MSKPKPCGAVLHFENIAGLLVTTTGGRYSWRCPECHAAGNTKRQPRIGQRCREPKR